MRIKRTLPVLIAVLLIAAAITALVQLRKHAPPEAARLLPGADGFFYVNFRWIRTFNVAKLPPISHDPDYQKFVEDTGVDFERDLEEVACAVHYPQAWGDGTGTAGSATELRFSWVFVGKIDASKLNAYLKKAASSVDNYRGFDIYNIPLEERTVRVALLSYNSVAVSNHPDENVIRGILDRSRKLASPFGGPSLLRRFYKRVPFASLSWGIVRVGPNQIGGVGGLGNWAMLFPKPAVVVVSGRYLRALHLRAEAFANNEQDAKDITEKADAFLSIFHVAEISVGTQGTDVDVKGFFDSLKVSQSGERAILTATIPPGFLRKALTEAAPEAQTPAVDATPPRKTPPVRTPATKPGGKSKKP